MLISAFHLTGATYPNLALPSHAIGMIFHSTRRCVLVHIPRLPNLFNTPTYVYLPFSACNIERLGMGPGNEATYVRMYIRTYICMYVCMYVCTEHYQA